jgi:predicted Zn-dependent protease
VAIRPRTVKHELGHAFGYWHTGNAQDLMSGLAVSECDREPSAREVYHATVAYQTPIGTSTARPRSSARAVILD